MRRVTPRLRETMIAALGLLAPVLALQAITSKAPAQAVATDGGAGQMCILDGGRRVPMPLERTSVRAEIAGIGARVTLVQTFVNPSAKPIEAIYTFPLPESAAVDRMRIRIGSRVIEGEIRRREEARKIYDDAKNRGQAAALLDQETGDVFTQSVANVAPGGKIEVEISYVQALKFEAGEFEFAFPMVVGPRYLGAGTKEPGKLDPPRVRPGQRSGQNVDLNVTIHGGAPITAVDSVLHQVNTVRRDASTVEVSLAKRDEIPNRDFILHYRTTTNEVRESLLTHWDAKTGGHFALVLAPPARAETRQRAPKEIVFVMDQSGSQSGFPIEKSKELVLKLIDTLGPNDRFNVLGFSDQVNPLWPGPRAIESETLAQARAFVRGLQANGGTQMERAVVAALSPPSDPKRVRIVLFNTDGLAGQEETILGQVRRFRGSSRLFTFGIGNSVNRGLISAMSREGRGADEVVTLAGDADAAVARFSERLTTPVLVDPKVEFSGGAVADVVPAALPDVFSTRPVVLYGRYTRPGRTRLTLTGRTAAGPWRREIEVDLPETEGDGSSISSLWARARIADLQSASYADRAIDGKATDVTEPITRLALEYGLVTPQTSFVAVDRTPGNESAPETVRVPVEAVDGMADRASPILPTAAAPMGLTAGGGYGGGGGFRGNGGVMAKSSQVRTRSGGLIPESIQFLSYDLTDNSLIVQSEDGKGRPAGKRTVEIERGLLEAKGKTDLRVMLTGIDPARIAALRKAGFVVESHDGATLVFGSANAAQIRAIAKLEGVVRIARLRPLPAKN